MSSSSETVPSWSCSSFPSRYTTSSCSSQTVSDSESGPGPGPAAAAAAAAATAGTLPSSDILPMNTESQCASASLPQHLITHASRKARLFHHVLNDNTDELQRLLSSKLDFNVDRRNRHGWTSLQEACYAGKLEAVRLLLSAGADVNRTDEFGWTPLMLAAEKGHVLIVSQLLAANANIFVRNGDGSSLVQQLASIPYRVSIQIRQLLSRELAKRNRIAFLCCTRTSTQSVTAAAAAPVTRLTSSPCFSSRVISTIFAFLPIAISPVDPRYYSRGPLARGRAMMRARTPTLSDIMRSAGLLMQASHFSRPSSSDSPLYDAHPAVTASWARQPSDSTPSIQVELPAQSLHSSETMQTDNMLSSDSVSSADAAADSASDSYTSGDDYIESLQDTLYNIDIPPSSPMHFPSLSGYASRNLRYSTSFLSNLSAADLQSEAAPSVCSDIRMLIDESCDAFDSNMDDQRSTCASDFGQSRTPVVSMATPSGHVPPSFGGGHNWGV
jgi:Ankyrin repeats (3 copies)